MYVRDFLGCVPTTMRAPVISQLFLLFVVARYTNSALAAAAPASATDGKKDATNSYSSRAAAAVDDTCSPKRLLFPGGALAKELFTCKPIQLCNQLLAEIGREKKFKLDVFTGLAGFCEAACDLHERGCDTNVTYALTACGQPLWVVRRSISIPGAELGVVCDGQVVYEKQIWTLVPPRSAGDAGSPEIFAYNWLKRPGEGVLSRVHDLSNQYNAGCCWLLPPALHTEPSDPPVIIRGATCWGRKCYGR